MTKKEIIDEFMSQKDIAIVGCSRDSKKFGTYLLKELKQKGYKLYPVHRQAKEIECLPCYSAIEHLPDHVDTLLITTPPDQTEILVQEAIAKGIKRIWMQQGAESPAAIENCKQNNISLVDGECVMMFAEPLGFIHNLHRFIWKIVGKYPKN
jgi:uncharacterized protein